MQIELLSKDFRNLNLKKNYFLIECIITYNYTYNYGE